MEFRKNIVSTEWLHHHLLDEDLVILETLQPKNKAGLNSEVLGSISGSISVDLKQDFSNPKGRFPNTFPSIVQFETICSKLGINNQTTVIIVDRLGIYTSPRLWFLFRAMGHEKVAVLNGGLPAWIKDRFPVVERKNIPIINGNYSARLQSELVKSISQVKENIKSQHRILIDARSSDRFYSLVPEPRPEIRNGNIPNSINIPFQSLLDDNKYKSKEELTIIFDKYKLADKPLIFSCGSGVTACIVMLAAEMVNNNLKSIYDGSWTEFATLVEG